MYYSSHSILTNISCMHHACIMHASYKQADGSFITGAVGPETGGLTIEEGKAAARQCALNLVATLKNQLGDLDRVEQIIKVS